jgi:exosortase
MASSSLRKELECLIPSPRARWAWLLVAVAFVVFYWTSIQFLCRVWWNQEDYNHGFFVPCFSLFLLWHRRDMIPKDSASGSLWGLPVFALWAAMMWSASYFDYGSLPELSMVPFFVGVALFVSGWQGLRWAWPAILFLVFMLPLPGAIEDISRDQLQHVATYLSAYAIQTLGIPATAEGNVIQMTEKSLEVAQACSGLRMMMLFFAICVGAAFVVRRPLWERLVMVASAAPIAILSNVARIVLTGVLCDLARRWPSLINVETAEKFMHDMAGLLMMPIGLALLFVEMSLISKLLISPPSSGPLATGGVLAGEPIEAAMQPGLQRRRPG